MTGEEWDWCSNCHARFWGFQETAIWCMFCDMLNRTHQLMGHVTYWTDGPKS